MAESKMRVNRAGDYLAAVLRGDEPFDGDRFVAEATVMIAWRREHAYPLNLCVPGLRNWVERESSLDITPVQRLKRAPRIVEKLVRHPEMKLARMQDIGGTRAILGKPAEVEAVARQIRRHWQVSREADYRDTPRPDTGYRALHVMVVKRERVVEVQLRTRLQHEWAEAVERTGSRLGYSLKDGEGPADLIEYFRIASDLLWYRDTDTKPDDETEFLQAFSEVREKVRPYFPANP